MPTRLRKLLCCIALVAVTAAGERALAQGFQLNRLEPASPGNAFIVAQHPWYSSTRWLAAGITLDYGHNVLLGGQYPVDGGFERRASIVAHQLTGRLEVAGSFLDRVQVSASLPIVLLERGTAAYGVAPIDGAAVSDPRVSALARIWGDAERDLLSIHGGVHLWIPTRPNDRAADEHAGDPGVRVAPEVIAAGAIPLSRLAFIPARIGGALRWSFSTGVLIRGATRLGFGPASDFGSEWLFKGGIAYTDAARRIHVGPEAWISTAITGADAPSVRTTSFEFLFGGHYRIARLIQVGAGVGTAFASTLGVPDFRAVLRIAYAPVRSKRPGDFDGDGVPDAQDGCPEVIGLSGAGGCPDRDEDGVPDAEDVCPTTGAGAHPDKAARRGGCPAPDGDKDGVPDAEDLCPGESPGQSADAARAGCPAPDRDKDGVPDADDQCPDVAIGAKADTRRAGCPLPDKDGDGIPDENDACPNLAGVTDPDKRRSGCPKLDDTTTELKSVQFDTNEATLLPESFPILDEVAALLKSRPDVLAVEISGHADDTGTPAFNLRLSKQRAESVVRYLVEHGVEKKRLRAVGYGDTRPLAKEQTDEARARNRRVEMRVPKAGEKLDNGKTK